jgi:hypothetical protein
MLIEGPLKVSVIEDPNATNAELHLDFTEGFRALPQAQQGAMVKDYVRRLQGDIFAEPEGSDDRQGMLVLQQVAEKLLPHIVAGEVPLHETIVIELQVGTPLGRFISGNDGMN